MKKFKNKNNPLSGFATIAGIHLELKRKMKKNLKNTCNDIQLDLY